MITRRAAAPATRRARDATSTAARRRRRGGRPLAQRSEPSRPRYPLGVMVRTAVSRRRRLLAAVLLSAAAAVAILQLSPARQPTVPTVVASGSLGAGTVLAPEDLEVIDYPAALVPGARADDADAAASAGSPDDWVGRTLAGPLIDGQPLTAASVLGPDLLSGQPAGTTAVTIRVADAGALTHLRPGQHVDLILRSAALGSGPSPEETDPPRDPELSAAEQTTRIGSGLPVLWVADPVAPADGILAQSAEVQDDLLVVGADARTAARIAATEEGELVPVLVASPEDEADDGADAAPGTGAAAATDG